MDMVARRYPADDLHTVFRAHLPDDVPDTHPKIPAQHLVAIRRRPHDMIPMGENAVLALVVMHDLMSR